MSSNRRAIFDAKFFKTELPACTAAHLLVFKQEGMNAESGSRDFEKQCHSAGVVSGDSESSLKKTHEPTKSLQFRGPACLGKL